MYKVSWPQYWLWLVAFFSGVGMHTSAQCPALYGDTVLWENFESGLPRGWEAPPATYGENWQISADSFGWYGNPGSGQWAYINDAIRDRAGQAELTSAWLDLPEGSGGWRLACQLNFQPFADSGFARIDMWNGEVWQILYQESDDFTGLLTLDLPDIAGKKVRFRFVYNDEGAWGWGLGIDEVLLTRAVYTCGDGRCEPGETRIVCPGDCPALTDPAPLWITPGTDLSGQAVSYRFFKGKTACDDCSEQIPLGFSFQFYGQSHTQVWINSNGNLTFGDDYTTFTPRPFCLDSVQMIAPFYGDVDLSRGGEIVYYRDPEGHYLIVSWIKTGYFGCRGACTQTNTFQVILTDGSITRIREQILPAGTSVIFSYGDMQWTTGSSSGGTGGFGGHAATIGVNLGDGVVCQDYGRFDREGVAYYGNTADQGCPPNEVSHLDFRSVCFNGRDGVLATPMGIVTFSGQPAGTDIILTWETDDLAYASTFELSVSADSQYFTPIDTIPLQAGTVRYSFADTAFRGDHTLYRLRLLRQSGTPAEAFTRVHRPATGGPGGETDPAPLHGLRLLAVGPNPFDQTLTIRYEGLPGVSQQWLLTDMAGRVYMQGEMIPADGEHVLTLDTDRLPAAMFVFTMWNHQRRVYATLVKQ
ncbi:MAG: hypothetical protein SF053_16910 [Bacteroidia bacterium]|nr:hypothetical protein [Bacteroidia bacterium]